MPAKDEYGSQPPLELVRQWIDYGFWYDRLKQTTKEIRVRLQIYCGPPRFDPLVSCPLLAVYVPTGSDGSSWWR